MNQSTARKELREARRKGFCGFCFATGPAGYVLTHKSNCKILSHAGYRSRAVQR